MRGASITSAAVMVGMMTGAACTFFVSTDDLSTNPATFDNDASLPKGSSSGNPSLVGEGGSSSSGESGADGSLQSYAEMVLATPGLIGYWRFADPTGSTSAVSAMSSSGGKAGKINQGVNVSAPSAIKNDPADRSFAFNDTNESAVVDFGPDAFAFEGKSPFSIELWHAPSSLQGFQALIGKHNLANPGASGWVMSVEDPYGYAVYREDGTDGDSVETRLVPVAGEVHHVVATFDGTYLHLFVDAKEPKSPRLCARSLPINPSLPLRVGTSTFGRLDEVALYNRALTAAEIDAHYTKGK